MDWKGQTIAPSQPSSQAIITAGGDKAGAVVSALDLAGADIVLTTYDVLRKDAWRVDWPERRLRHAKKYEVGSSS